MEKKGKKKSTDKTIGAAVRNARVARGISQKQLASFLGVTYQQQQKYETGVNRISAERLGMVCQHFGVTSEELLGTKPVEGGSLRGNLELVKAINALPPDIKDSFVQLLKRIGGTYESAST